MKNEMSPLHTRQRDVVADFISPRRRVSGRDPSSAFLRRAIMTLVRSILKRYTGAALTLNNAVQPSALFR